MSAKRRPKKRGAATPASAKSSKSTKPTKPTRSTNSVEPKDGVDASALQSPPSSAPRRPRSAASAPGAASRFFDAAVGGAARLKTPKFVSKTFGAFFRTSASPKTPIQEADDRQARFVAGVAALAFVVAVVFFLAGKASRRLDPPPGPSAATIPTPQKLADAVAAEVEKARSDVSNRRAIVETSVKTAPPGTETNDAATAPPAETLAFVVELNSASKAELTNLPRVGEKLAERIVERREELGGFRSVDDLLGVKGIGEKTLDKMRPFCVVAPLDDAE